MVSQTQFVGDYRRFAALVKNLKKAKNKQIKEQLQKNMIKILQKSG